MYLHIDYGDQNERFASCLPRDGKVVSKPLCSDSKLDWYLVRLDKDIEYNGVLYSHFLLASRWKGYFIGDNQPVPVFILLVPPDQSVIPDGFSYNQFHFVAWGTASVIPDQSLTNGN